MNSVRDIFFFGDQAHGLEQIKNQYPFTFHELEQVHGDRLVRSSADKPMADAHWTDQPGIALLIKTADCLPVLVSHPRYICAIHAGWRGVLNEIVFKSLRELQTLFGADDSTLLQIGPHLQFQSFEITDDLLPQFHDLARRYNISHYCKPHHSQPNKYFVNLSTLVQAQIESLQISSHALTFQTVDTLTDSRYHSYRRDKNLSGRNYSFVARPK